MKERDSLKDSCIGLVPIFSNLTYEEMLEVATIANHKNYKKGEMVYEQGDDGDSLYVVHKGQIKITRFTENGKEQVIRVLGPGDFMGELSIFSGQPVNDYAESLAEANVCVIDGTSLRQLMNKYPSITLKIMAELSQRLEKVEQTIEVINHHSVESRLARVLIDMANEVNEITLPISKSDLASQIGITQETLSRKLSLFNDKGYIKQIGHRRIIILQLKALINLIDE